MAGGTFLSMNKVRAGAYLNFKSVPRPLMTVGDRGIATIGLELNWGAENELIDVYSDELVGTASLSKVGFTASDTESKLLNILLQNCYQAKVYKLNKGGTKATATIGELNTLTVTAIYKGTFGNKITISVVKEGELYNISTFVNGSQKDSQKVATIEELETNDFVTFSGTGVPEENAGIPLTGGENGTFTKSTVIPEYLELLKTARWQTACFPQLGDDDSNLKANIATFIENQRDGEGRYVQAVLANYPQANYEGIISNTNGAVINEVEFTKEEMTACIAGLTAGANINESNTNQIIEGATQIIGQLDNAGIIKALNNGELVLSANQRGDIKIEKDINSYHTFTTDKNYEFSKNRVLRTLDEIGISISDIWEQSYMGKVDNNEDGRAIFKADIDNYLKQLEGMNAIQEYVSSGGADNITISQGADLDVVVVELYIKPVDSMEILYCTVNVRV